MTVTDPAAGLGLGAVTMVSRSATHTMAKSHVDAIRLVAGSGVQGDAYQGETVKHRSRVARDPCQPNLRQVHLIHAELHNELAAAGFPVEAGQMGENITTRGIDLLALIVIARCPQAVLVPRKSNLLCRSSSCASS